MFFSFWLLLLFNVRQGDHSAAIANSTKDLRFLELHTCRMTQCFLLKCKCPQIDITLEAIISYIYLSIGLLKSQLAESRFG